MASILDTVGGSPQTQSAVDTITSILNQHAQPTVGDAAQAATQNLIGITDPNHITPPNVTPQGVANANAEAQVQSPLGIMDIMGKAAQAGSQQAASVLDTFKQFAPDPGDLGKLLQAAHDDPQQITPQNAASWAAQKAPELGLGKLTSATKQANLDDITAQTAQRNAIAKSKLTSGAEPGALPIMGDDGNIAAYSSPPDGTVASLAGASSPAPAAGIVTTYQGTKAPTGKMFVRKADGSVALAPIPSAGPAPVKTSPLSAPEEKLLDEGTQKAQGATRLLTSFKPEYAGLAGGSETLANLELGYDRRMAASGSPEEDRANWWQDYQNYLNTVRHGVFGARLTPFEVDQFNKAAVTPNMAPDLAQKNLDRQSSLLQQALVRQAQAAAAGGRNPDQIAKLTGLSADILQPQKATPTSSSNYGSPDDVKSAVTSGKLDRAAGLKILQTQFGMQ